RGRTLRELVLAVAVIAPVVTTFWFTVVGGTGISQEINVPGSVSEALDAAGPPAAMMAITENLPLSAVFGVLFLIVTTVFVLTRSEEHTSELQSRFDLVCRLLLEKTNSDTIISTAD